jgi:carbohydrate kinase (thermoresistant glucokinase family)
VRKSLQERCVYHTLSFAARKKIIPLPTILHHDKLGLREERYQEVVSNLTSVIHCAWSVNFNLALESFENDCIVGAENLLKTCLAVQRPTPASFNFCSSVSAVAATPSGVVPEALPASLSYVQNMGYAQSKLVTEHICVRAASQTNIRARVLRIGQMIGDTKHGVWNATEAIPMIFQTARTIGALPQLDERPSWLPVDKVGQATVEISLSDVAGGQVMNVINNQTFHWTHDLLPMLKVGGLGDFEELPQRKWIERLRNSNSDPVANPPIKLVEFFAKKYDTDLPRPSLSYNSHIARETSLALREAGIVNKESIAKCVSFWDQNSWNLTKRSKATAIMVCGPCGAGKSTTAKYLSKQFGVPMIEGDELHLPEAVAKMANGEQLIDSERWDWLQRIKDATLMHLDSGTSVIVACSALKSTFRESLRQIRSQKTATGTQVDVKFIFLYPFEEKAAMSAEALKQRLEKREGHYMKADMVETQLALCEWPLEDETDVVPVDSLMELDELQYEVEAIAKDFLQ